jgi:hypothetical protein
MSLNTAHEGYEYQDLLSAYFILDWILEDVKSIFVIDKKEFESDRFDDLTIQNEHGIFKKQIKYSNQDINHSLEKSDLSTDGSYKLAIDELFKSWNLHPSKKSLNVRLCLAWNEPTDELTNILVESSNYRTFKNHKTNLYKINVQKLWPEKQEPIGNWRRFKAESKNINRDDFIKFCENLTIETNFPKSSTYIFEPDKLEKIVLDQVDRLGIGIFPNKNWKKEEFVLSLLSLIKKSRSKGASISTDDIFSQFQIKTNFGSVEQNFPVDDSKCIPLSKIISFFISKLNEERKIILTGEPGSGKSWFINNLIKGLKDDKINTIKHYCYTDIQDKYQKERIKIDVFYGNLISDILKVYPHLKKTKHHRYASNLSELNILIDNIDEPTVLIIDGIDHIERIFNYRPYKDIAISDIEIIKEISKIKCNEYMSILVASQPIVELDNITGFNSYSLPNWTRSEVVELMNKLYLNDFKIEEQFLSELLFEKSSGNPLYLTYLIEELKGVSNISKDVLKSLPAYSFNLKEYYNYLLSKLNFRDNIPLVLSAVNFSLTKIELKDITGLGNFVDDSLDLLRPVLKQNHSSSGYLIYHESFRRFIIEYLKTKKIVEEKIFRPVIDWFEGLDFYTYPKAFRFYLQVLTDGGYFSKAIKFISKDFIKKSVYAGQPWEIIKNNYHLLVKAGAESKDVCKIILLNELNKTLSSTEDSYNESFSYYIEALGCEYGFEQVVDFLVFEGEPTLSLYQGLKVCYLIDTKRKVAPWDYYSDYFKEGEPVKIDDFHYYIRLLLVNQNIEGIQRIAEKIASKNLQDFKDIFINELENFWNKDFINELLERNTIVKKLSEKKSSSVHIEKHDLKILAEEILSFTNVFDSEIPIIKEFFRQIKLQIEENEAIIKVVKMFSAKNWFYNWLIFYIKIHQVKTLKQPDCSQIKSAFDYLAYKTEPFEGKPRACDLHSLNSFIFESINEGLSLVISQEDWEYILHKIEIVSTKTTTYFQNSPGGPIATDNLFKLCIENINEINVSIVVEILERQYERNKGSQFHAFLAEYCFQLAKAYSFVQNKEKTDYFFKQGVDYILGYTWRRDLTLEDLTESIEHFKNIDNTLGNEYILKLKNLVDSVVEHTDGKDTKHFPVEWFEKFYNINAKKASLYLLNELAKKRYDWRLESSLKYLLNQSNGSVNILTECYLNQTLLVESDDLLLSKSLSLIDSLNSSPARNTLIATINSKIEIKQNSERSIDFQKKLSKYSDDFNLPVNYFSSLKAKNSKKISSIDPIVKLKRECIARKEFSKMPPKELSEYLKENTILEKEIQSLIYIFDSFQNLTPELKKIIQHLVGKNEHYHDENEIDITFLFDSNTEISVFFWVARFVYQKDGWFKSLSNINAFAKAYELNPTKSLEFLFDLLPDKLDLGNNRVFSANLLNALSKAGYDSLIVKKAWLTLYEMIESRLPTKDRFDWDIALANELEMNMNEVYICLLLSRFKSYTVQKFHIVLSGIANLLFENSEQLVKPLKWFFKKNEIFKKSIILSILELIILYEKENIGYIKNFESELESIYPTKYFLIDYLIEVSFKIPTHRIIQSTNDLTYPISNKESDFFIGLNYRHSILEKAGINIKNTFGKFKATFSNKYQDDLELYGNRMYERSVNNIYFSDYMLELINVDYYYIFKRFSNLSQVYQDLKIDIKTIIAQYLSSSIRPKQLKKYAEYNGISSYSEDIPIDKGWVRLGHFESELIEQERYKLENNKTFGGITFHVENKSIFPFSGYRLSMDCIWEGVYPAYKIEETIVFSFIQKEVQFEDFKILWLNPVIVKTLELQVCDFLSGLCAVNIDNEIVLKFNSWYSDYLATDYSNDIRDEIPKLDGSELLIREDYFNRICEMYDTKPKYCIVKTF